MVFLIDKYLNIIFVMSVSSMSQLKENVSLGRRKMFHRDEGKPFGGTKENLSLEQKLPLSLSLIFNVLCFA